MGSLAGSADGVEIILVSGTYIPQWMARLDKRVTAERVVVNGRFVRRVRIEGGRAAFTPTNRIEVCMPGSSQSRAAFHKDRVLEIRDWKGGLLKRNYFMCARCVANSGQISSTAPSQRHGRNYVVMECLTCGERWEIPEF